jgi:hypothetical protein
LVRRRSHSSGGRDSEEDFHTGTATPPTQPHALPQHGAHAACLVRDSSAAVLSKGGCGLGVEPGLGCRRLCPCHKRRLGGRAVHVISAVRGGTRASYRSNHLRVTKIVVADGRRPAVPCAEQPGEHGPWKHLGAVYHERCQFSRVVVGKGRDGDQGSQVTHENWGKGSLSGETWDDIWYHTQAISLAPNSNTPCHFWLSTGLGERGWEAGESGVRGRRGVGA